jgi:hypothetical protein
MCWLGKTLLLVFVLAALRTLIGRIGLLRAAQALGAAVLLGLLAAGFLFTQVGSA